MEKSMGRVREFLVREEESCHPELKVNGCAMS